MSRTFKKYPRHWYRRPSGRKRALVNGVRKRAVPPDPYDDIHPDRQCFSADKVGLELHKLGWSNEKIAKRLSWRFKVPYLVIWHSIIPDKPFDWWWSCKCKECNEKYQAWREWRGGMRLYSWDELAVERG